ncbi:unnamed protein product [Blepharisma stoltei]|uniref:Thioredoxin-like fold domain-containing protein n=1 Tax=Blepharisma stoltei TaxID=1481888 RepID=A0AAU9JX38_9CILI|nr:unnamed protein product [Blepharisma stoltei]
MIIIGSLILVLAAATQVTPIPHPYDGLFLGPLRSNYTLELFMDHLDPQSKLAYPSVMQYYNQNQKWLGLIIHIFPLSYRLLSFNVALAGRFIQMNYTSTNFTSYIDIMFQKQEAFIQQANQNDFQTMQNTVTLYAMQATGASFNTILNGMNAYAANRSLRNSYDFACSIKMPGTPSYLINGVWVPDASNITTVSGWQQLFNSISN